MSGRSRIHPETDVKLCPPSDIISQQPDQNQVHVGRCSETANSEQMKKDKKKRNTFSHSSASVFSMSILNKHEFDPHPSINLLSQSDKLLVQEEYSHPFNEKNSKSVLRKGENTFKVYDSQGSHLFTGIEDPITCCFLFQQISPFKIHLFDAKNPEDEVMSLTKSCSCLIHCQNEVKVYSPPGNLLGTIAEGCGVLHPTYYLIDATMPETPLFQLTAPIFTFSCFGHDVDFPVYDVSRGQSKHEKVGVISKKWGGLVRELFSDSDTFGVSFPREFAPKYKALFLAACFLMDRKYFDRPS